MKNFEKKLNKIDLENTNYILIFDDINNNQSYQTIVNKNLKNIINKKNYPIFYIDIKKYHEDFYKLYDFKISNYPFIMKIENNKLIESFDKLIINL